MQRRDPSATPAGNAAGPPLRFTVTLNDAPRPPTEIELSPPLLKLKRKAETGGAAETEAHAIQRVGPEGRPEQGSGCPADAAVRKSMRPAHGTVGSADSRGGECRLRSIELTGFEEVREQDLPGASTSAQKAYFELEGRPGSQPDPHPPKESGQGSPEPVRIAEVRVKRMVAEQPSERDGAARTPPLMSEPYATSDSGVLKSWAA